MPETTPLIKAALNLRGGAGFDVYDVSRWLMNQEDVESVINNKLNLIDI